jgi:hypothetical protein
MLTAVFADASGSIGPTTAPTTAPAIAPTKKPDPAGGSGAAK